MPVVEKQIPTNQRGVFRTVEEYVPPKLRSWAELTEEVQVPPDIAAALMTGRRELIRPVCRALSYEEANQLLNLLRVFIDTNRELQEHCSRLANKCDALYANFKAVMGTVRRIGLEAEFKNPETCDEEEE